MPITSFTRAEQKYRLTLQQYGAVRAALEGHMQLDEYGVTAVRSEYWDTPYNDLISRSIERPRYKEKLRVRSYAPVLPAIPGMQDEPAPVCPTPRPGSLVFIEMKKKYNGVVYKRRIGLSVDAARAFLGGMSYEDAVRSYPLDDIEAQAQTLASGSIQRAREIEAMIGRYPDLEPSMRIMCTRSAFCPVPGAVEALACELRITFDEHLEYMDMRIGRHGSFSPQPIIPADEIIMEVKAIKSVPLWLASVLSEQKAYQVTFSKYATAYEKAYAH